ncbi:MAG TPA: hypothetical protein DCZ75_07670, partial [Geobacter sp.]|nr:hypothetical protein [Geobacter sp.]
MAFFGLFGKKDHRHYQTQGAKHLCAERYADARIDFMEALRLCPAEAAPEQQEIQLGLDQACNRLGELNIMEGEHAFNAGELEKADDHFSLAAELAVDPEIKKMARGALLKLQQPASAKGAAPAKAAAPAHKAHGGSSCSSCSGHDHGGEELQESHGMDLSEEDRFHLMVQPLGDLAPRYSDLGPKFMKAYLLLHDGNDAAAFPILQEMLLSGENDIVFYEVALIMYRAGRIHESEGLINKALSLNPTNSMCYMALVQLMAGSGRYPEAIAVVNRMLELGVMADQAQYMLGELHEASGDEDAAFEIWSRALEIPTVA